MFSWRTGILTLILLFAHSSLQAATSVDLIALKRIVVNGQNTVASAGTAEVLGSSESVRACSIKALASNSGIIYIGTSAVDNTNGYELLPGESVTLDVDNVADIYIDAEYNTNGVSYICIG